MAPQLRPRKPKPQELGQSPTTKVSKKVLSDRKQTLRSSSRSSSSLTTSPLPKEQPQSSSSQLPHVFLPPNPHSKVTLDLKSIAERYLAEGEEYMEKAERYDNETDRHMYDADLHSVRGDELAQEAHLHIGQDAVNLFEAARHAYNDARICLDASRRCNEYAKVNFKTARDYYEAYGRCLKAREEIVNASLMYIESESLNLMDASELDEVFDLDD